jgi:hypothetical protein
MNPLSQFIENLVKPHVLHQDLELTYREMALDEEREHVIRAEKCGSQG